MYKKILLTLILIMILFSFIIAGATGHDNKFNDDPKNVLVIFSYSPSFPSTDLLMSGLNCAFNGENVHLQIEFMDSKLINSKEHTKLFLNSLKNKLMRLRSVDLVITFDDNALIFIQNYYYYLFEDMDKKNVPVVFSGCNNISLGNAVYQKNENFTGQLESSVSIKTLDLATELNPAYRSINVLIDNSTTAQADADNLRYQNNGKYDINFINSTHYTYEELSDLLSTFTKDDIVFFEACFTDKNFQKMTIEQASNFLNNCLDTPIYCDTPYNIETIFAGGYVVDEEAEGCSAGRIGMGILFEDKSPKDFMLSNDTTKNLIYQYNYEILSKYDLDISVLPSSTIFLNKQPGIFDQYPQLPLYLIIFGSLLLIVIFALLYYAIQKHLHAKQHEKISLTDHLTQSGNRIAFYSKIEYVIQNCLKHDEQATMIFFDIDKFKEINDEFGHTIGDIVLYSTAKRIQNAINGFGDIYRYGGDEFIILLNIAGKNAMPYIKKVIKSFSNPIKAENEVISVSISMGAVEIPTNGTNADELISKADAAMYKAKEYHTSRVVFHIGE